MSAKREKQVRKADECRSYRDECRDKAEESESYLASIMTIHHRIGADQSKNMAYTDAAVLSEARQRKAELHRLKVAMAAGFAAVSMVSGAALALAIHQPEDERPEVAKVMVSFSPTKAATLDPVEPTAHNYISSVPLVADDQAALEDAANEFGVPYPLALAVVERETGFRNVAGDGGKSIGYMQVNDHYHVDLMADIGASDLWDPEDNFRTGLAILADAIQDTGTLHEALMAYNMGPTGARRCWDRGIYSSEYSREVVMRSDYWAKILGE